MARILVTGAGGFIGRSLCRALAVRGHHVIAGLRTATTTQAFPISEGEPRILGDIGAGRDWAPALADVEIVIHLAQPAHRRAEEALLAGAPTAAAALARGAARAGVRRLVYVSSIKAMGEATRPGRPFRGEDPPRPEDRYGRMKLATERALRGVAGESGVELAILRPPLVYGPGVRGNFRALARLAASGLPLPFATVDNRRSLLFLDNMVDLTRLAAEHPAAVGLVLTAADATLSTPALIRLLARGQGRVARLFAVPEAALAVLRRLPSVGPSLARLTLSLEIDDGTARTAFGWTPPIAGEKALVETARALALG